MAQQQSHNVPITTGKGSLELVNGHYSATASVEGYDNSTLNPTEIDVVTGVDTYNFTIAAEGTLKILVTDDGQDIGVPIVGAKFYRTDKDGKKYGDVLTTGDDGYAIFNNVPYGQNITIYFIQTESDGQHTFDDQVQNTTMDQQEKTIIIKNESAQLRNFTLTDANYENLPILDGVITLTNN